MEVVCLQCGKTEIVVSPRFVHSCSPECEEFVKKYHFDKVESFYDINSKLFTQSIRALLSYTFNVGIFFRYNKRRNMNKHVVHMRVTNVEQANVCVRYNDESTLSEDRIDSICEFVGEKSYAMDIYIGEPTDETYSEAREVLSRHGLLNKLDKYMEK